MQHPVFHFFFYCAMRIKLSARAKTENACVVQFGNRVVVFCSLTISTSSKRCVLQLRENFDYTLGRERDQFLLLYLRSIH